jgi:hypothetical protein
MIGVAALPTRAPICDDNSLPLVRDAALAEKLESEERRAFADVSDRLTWP